MITKHFFTSLLFWLSVTTLAQDKEGTVLFEVRHPDREYVSYLFGTNHAFSKSFIDRFPIIQEKLLSTKRVILEADLSLPENSVDDIVRSRKEVTKWKRYFNTEDLEFVKEIVKRDDEVFNRFTPAELYSALYRYLAMQICGTRTTNDPEGSLDDYMGSLAKGNNISLTGLETVAFQLSVINDDVKEMPAKVHKRRLQALIHKIKTKSTANCDAYDRYSHLTYDFQFNTDCSNKVVLVDRNAEWMQQLPKYFLNESCFIAVGLAHLQFSCGLIAQLRDRGCIVTPIPLH